MLVSQLTKVAVLIDWCGASIGIVHFCARLSKSLYYAGNICCWLEAKHCITSWVVWTLWAFDGTWYVLNQTWHTHRHMMFHVFINSHILCAGRNPDRFLHYWTRWIALSRIALCSIALTWYVPYSRLHKEVHRQLSIWLSWCLSVQIVEVGSSSPRHWRTWSHIQPYTAN